MDFVRERGRGAPAESSPARLWTPYRGNRHQASPKQQTSGNKRPAASVHNPRLEPARRTLSTRGNGTAMVQAMMMTDSGSPWE